MTDPNYLAAARQARRIDGRCDACAWKAFEALELAVPDVDWYALWDKAAEDFDFVSHAELIDKLRMNTP